MATLRDLDLEPFETRSADQLPVTAPGDRWVVLVGTIIPDTTDDSETTSVPDTTHDLEITGDTGAMTGPVGAVAPGTTLATGTRTPSILVAAADLEQGAAFDSAPFREFMNVSALVLVEPGAAAGDRPTIAGVVSDLVLERAMLRGPERAVLGITGPVLPGVPSVPVITRTCGYLEGSVACATLVSFRQRPLQPPPCPNGAGLAAHPFTW